MALLHKFNQLPVTLRKVQVFHKKFHPVFYIIRYSSKMSLLQNLQKKKASLKQTDTTITHADGKRFIERHSSSVLIPQTPTFGFVVDSSPDETPAQVIEHLFIGAQDCCAPDPIRKNKIDFVLSVGIEAPHKLPNVEYEFVECFDLPETDLKPVIIHCNKVIKKCLNSGENVLVHCNAGVSRSSAVVIGYLMQEVGLKYEDAHRLVKSVRPAIQPNPGFVQQLKCL